ncbi:MAG: OsmC family peroxiredoxin [Bernardetiaceae bacterium]|jgi:osmotically inducible protein OsmC|nr:OsmC family peroxiredoxin [Bernardetiaceae bacterium]
MKRQATAEWHGDLKAGSGTLTTPSQVLDQTQYSFKTRFESGTGTNPEESIAASHAGCFTMAVSAIFTRQGIAPTRLYTQATVEVDMANLQITGVHLAVEGTVPGITQAQFAAVASEAEQNCIISKALRVPITSEAKLIG